MVALVWFEKDVTYYWNYVIKPMNDVNNNETQLKYDWKALEGNSMDIEWINDSRYSEFNYSVS